MPLHTFRLWRRFRFKLVVAGIALFGVLVTLYSTSLGIGTDADSATYLMAARSVLAGKGLTLPTPDGRQIPMTSFPPLLPLVLAGFGFIGLDPMAGARWLNALIFGGDILLIAFLIKRHTRSAAAAVFAAFLTATTVDVLLNHCLLISEPLFMSFVLTGLALMGLYMERPSFPHLLLFSAALALASATRYAAISLLPVGTVAIVFGVGPWRRRWLHLGAFLAIFGIPLSLWALRNLTLVHVLTNRSLAFHPPGLNRFVYSYLNLSTWIFPSAVPQALRVLGLLGIILLLFQPLLRRLGTSSTPQVSLHNAGAMFVVSYVLLLLVSQIFFDAQIWIAGRHLLAVYLVGLVVVVCQGKQLLDNSTDYLRPVLVLLCFSIAGVGAVRMAKDALRFHQDGLGLSSRRWQNSGLAARVKQLDTRAPVYSNSGSALYLLTGRLAQSLPDRLDSQTQRYRPEYDAQMDRAKRQLQHEGGVIVVFPDFAAAGILASENELERQLGLQRVAITDVGYLLMKPKQGDAAP